MSRPRKLRSAARSTRRPRDSAAGFTLVETIAAVVILAIAVPPMLWALREAHVQRADPVLASRARWLASEKLEDVIADRHSSTRGWAWLNVTNYPPEARGTIPGYEQFSREVSFSETMADLETPGSGYMNVTVDVRWNDARGVERSLQIATVLTDYAP
jgi:prepilin-type N-terminal cleavage/methylation domain-containing protein